VIDDESGGDDSVDPTCEKVKDQVVIVMLKISVLCFCYVIKGTVVWWTT